MLRADCLNLDNVGSLPRFRVSIKVEKCLWRDKSVLACLDCEDLDLTCWTRRSKGAIATLDWDGNAHNPGVVASSVVKRFE